MWDMHGTCAGFDKQADYFSFALAAANKYNADVNSGVACTPGCTTAAVTG